MGLFLGFISFTGFFLFMTKQSEASVIPKLSSYILKLLSEISPAFLFLSTKHYEFFLYRE